jgi:hypothetical protein
MWKGRREDQGRCTAVISLGMACQKRVGLGDPLHEYSSDWELKHRDEEG